jgi:Skp family chaperone for outer membrane proteins
MSKSKNSKIPEYAIRPKFHRNRKTAVRLKQINLHDDGSFVAPHFLNAQVCFGDPIEYLFGQHDQPHQYKDKDPQPNGCALCPSKAACGTVSYKRLEVHSETAAKRRDWQEQTKALEGAAAFIHPSWGVLRKDLESRTWFSSEDRFREQRALDAARKRAAYAKRKRKTDRALRRLKSYQRDALRAAREERVALLEEAADAPNSPLYIRNLDDAGRQLTADVWEAEIILDHRHEARKISAAMILDLLKAEGKRHDKPDATLKTRINEARKRIKRLEREPEGGPTWPAFDRDIWLDSPVGNRIRGGNDATVMVDLSDPDCDDQPIAETVMPIDDREAAKIDALLCELELG